MIDAAIDLSTFYQTSDYDAETFEKFADAVYATARTHERFEHLTEDFRPRASSAPAEALKYALGQLLLGNFRDALEWFARGTDNKYRRYYAAQAEAVLGRHADAVADFQRAAEKGWDTLDANMHAAAALVAAGDVPAAEKLVQKHAQAGADRGEWYYVRGLVAESRSEFEDAAGLYEKALTLRPDHVHAMFRCAWLYDMRGDDDAAVELYDRLALQPRAHVNALINLAVLYEDRGQFDKALQCLRRVLAAYPNHTRALLFLKDVESSRLMVLDDTIERTAETRSRLLETPITEFDFSVRARNCLKKMRIQTLGDLLRLTEAELLAYKNFGETSLNEIRATLAKRGLHLGQAPEEIDVEAFEAAAQPKVTVPPGSEAVLTKSVSELELSVRARRCLQRLNIGTLGDLIQHTEADLLATRNFGVTSLSEIKARLADFGLALAPKT
jgi:DNA-directed RNA polymerase subunit alpha